MKEDKEKEKGEVSRRDFLVGAGAVVVGGAIGAGIPQRCAHRLRPLGASTKMRIRLHERMGGEKLWKRCREK